MKKSKSDEVKRRILKSLENRERIVHIEICKCPYGKGRWNLRIGDIIGATEISNGSIKGILKEIEIEMRCLK